MKCAEWTNQDAYLVVPAQKDRMFLAVLDGHGEFGSHIAGSVCGIFEQMAPGLLTLDGPQLPMALAQVFAIAQAALERDELARFSGTTAAVAIVDVASGSATTAHIGDSRLLIVSGDGEASFETADHICGYDQGSDWVPPCGAIIPEALVAVCGNEEGTREGLPVSRSLGDLEAQSVGLLSEPTVHAEVPWLPGMSLVLASDGVWQRLSQGAVGRLVAQADPSTSARSLVVEARSKWPSRGDADDITAVVVKSMISGAGALPVAAAGA